jgi:hypothetical protein
VEAAKAKLATEPPGTMALPKITDAAARRLWFTVAAMSCRAIVFAGLLVACGSPPPASAPPVAPPPAPSVTAALGDLAITHVTVVPMAQGGELADQTVIVRGDRIVAVAAAAAVSVPAGAQAIDGKGRWLMPGLADMHVHAWSDASLTCSSPPA